MNLVTRAGTALMIVAICIAASACGGGGGSSFSGGGTTNPTNTAAITVDNGVVSNGSSVTNSINTPYVSVTFCLPNSSTCQTVDHIEIDTGSYGLRVLSSAMSLALPLQTASVGGNLVECVNFVDGYIWGPVAL